MQLWPCNNGVPQTWALTAGGITGPIRGPASASMCLQPGSANSAGGNAVRVGRCDDGSDMRFTVATDGRIRYGTRCLEVVSSGTGAGSAVGINGCGSLASQTWAPQANGTIMNPASKRCLDASGGATVGAVIQLWNCSAVDGQKWALPVLA